MTQREKAIWNATKNRRELIAVGLSRRELFKLGLLTGAEYSGRSDAGGRIITFLVRRKGGDVPHMCLSPSDKCRSKAPPYLPPGLHRQGEG